MDSKAGALKPRPLGEVVNSTGVGEEVHFDMLHVATAGPLGLGQAGRGLKTSNYLFTIAEDVRGCVWLEPVTARTSAVTAETLPRWCAAMGVPRRFATLASERANEWKVEQVDPGQV